MGHAGTRRGGGGGGLQRMFGSGGGGGGGRMHWTVVVRALIATVVFSNLAFVAAVVLLLAVEVGHAGWVYVCHSLTLLLFCTHTLFYAWLLAPIDCVDGRVRRRELERGRIHSLSRSVVFVPLYFVCADVLVISAIVAFITPLTLPGTLYANGIDEPSAEAAGAGTVNTTVPGIVVIATCASCRTAIDIVLLVAFGVHTLASFVVMQVYHRYADGQSTAAADARDATGAPVVAAEAATATAAAGGTVQQKLLTPGNLPSGAQAPAQYIVGVDARDTAQRALDIAHVTTRYTPFLNLAADAVRFPAARA